MPKPVTYLCLWAAALAGVVAFSACTEEVTAVLGTDRSFSMFGILSPQLDSQWVRVFPIEERLEPAGADQLDATFTSTDLETGEEHVWRDSLIEDVFGQQAHVFWAPFQGEFGHRYRLHVRSSTGEESHVEVTVPPQTEVVVREPVIASQSVALPVTIVGDAPRLNRVEVVYNVAFIQSGLANPEGDDVILAYDDAPVRTEEGWDIRIHLGRDFRTVSETLGRRLMRPIDRTFGLVLLDVSLRLIVANEEWNPPGGVFDPNVLVQPGTMENVQNGFGFVGAGYRHEKTWTPLDEAIDATGFRRQEEDNQ